VRLEKVDKPKEEYSKGGIYIETRQDKELKLEQEGINLGTVLHIGPTAFRTKDGNEPWCKVGDVVQFHKYSGDLVLGATDGNEYRCIPDLDLKVVRTNDENEGIEI
jgi:co-chaperonin GroES (HSP10)